MPSLAEATDFVRTLAMAWKNLAAYPPGHPALDTSLEKVSAQLQELSARGDVVFGVTSDRLYVADHALDTPHAQKFAHALYRRGVAAIRFRSTGETGEVETLLRLLGVGQQSAPDKPLWDALIDNGVSSIELQPVDYSGVRITEDLDTPGPPRQEQRVLQRILQSIDHEGGPAGAFEQERDADLLELIARSVRDDDARASTFDPDATFGVGNVPIPGIGAGGENAGERVASELLSSTAAGDEDSIEEVLGLLRALPSDVRATILRAMFHQIATGTHDDSLLRRLGSELPSNEIIDALRRVSQEANLSIPAMRLLQSMTPVASTAEAPEVSREEVEAITTVFGDEDADRFNPSEHVALLEATTVHLPAIPQVSDQEITALHERLPSIGATALEVQLEQTLITMLEGAGIERAEAILQRLELLVQQMLSRSRFTEVVALLDRIQEVVLKADDPAVMSAIHEFFQRLAQVETVLELIDRLPRETESAREGIQQVLEKLGSVATRNLIAALAEEEDRSRRRRLLDLLVSMGNVIAPEVRPYLLDSRWYVVRNMIGLLQAVEDRSSLSELRGLARHPDLRIRLDAIKALLALEPNMPRHLLEAAIFDPDPKVAEAAIVLSGSYRIEQAMEPLLSILEPRDLFRRRRSLRLKAIHALGELGLPEALPRLEKFFRDSLLPWPARIERLSAWRSLAGYPRDAIEELIERGQQSRDSMVRQIASHLRSTT